VTIVAPLAISWISAVALALLDGRRRWVGWLAVGLLGASFVATAVLAGVVLSGGPEEMVAGGWAPGVGIVLRADALGVLFALVSSGALLAALVHQVLDGVGARTFPALVLFLDTGLNGLFLTGDVFNFYVFFELAMISSYVLSCYGAEGRQLAAGFIFAVVNLVGSFLFLLGVAAVYHVTGTLAMDDVAAALAPIEDNSVIVIAIAFFVAFGVKLGLFPFHFWLPAVYINSTPAVAAILSGAVANIGSYGLLRFGADILPAELATGATVLLVLGTASIVYGAVQALSRRTAPEVLAYSAIGQVGYVLVALAIGGPIGLGAAVVYAIANALNKSLLFLSTEIRGPLVGAAFVVGAFSVAGLPPSAGFFGKVEMFRAGIAADGVAASAALVALIFLGGALSFVYMFRIYQRDFWRDATRGREEWAEGPPPESRLALRLVSIALAALVIGLGVWPEPLLAAGQEAARALGAGASP
jgi:multicomponent Na+:H+ antiporter subunit D